MYVKVVVFLSDPRFPYILHACKFTCKLGKVTLALKWPSKNK